jgi:hypothetical protein
MKTALLVVFALLVFVPIAHAQRSESGAPTAIVGKPIYTSDGAEIGRVINLGSYGTQTGMIAEIGTALGFGARLVFVPKDLAVVHADRVVLKISSDRLSEVLGKDPTPN